MNDFVKFATAALLAAALAGCADDAPETEQTAADAPQTAAESKAPSRPEVIPAPDDVAAPPADATVTNSGLAYRRLKAGPADGPLVAANDTVTVHYTGWRAENGQMFDSSHIRGEPATFPVAGVIAGWTEALQLMRPGDTFRVWIPGDLAYDNSSRPGAPKGMLVFDIELLEIRAKD